MNNNKNKDEGHRQGDEWKTQRKTTKKQLRSWALKKQLDFRIRRRYTMILRVGVCISKCNNLLNVFTQMWQKAIWTGHPMRLELTSKSLLVWLTNHYTAWGAHATRNFVKYGLKLLFSFIFPHYLLDWESIFRNWFYISIYFIKTWPSERIV